MTTKAATHIDRSGQNQSLQSQGTEYYGTLAKEVYAAARRENWTADKVKNMLANPKTFEKYLSKSSNYNSNLSIQSQSLTKMPSVVDRMTHDTKKRLAEKEKNEQQLKARLEQEEMEQVMTVKPVNAVATRSVKQFIEDQISHEQRRYEKLAEIVQSEEDQTLFRPQINPTSRKIYNQKNQRELGGSPGEDNSTASWQRKTYEAEQPSFQPEILKKSKQIKRNVPCHQLMMADAARRDMQRSEAMNHKQQSELNAPKVKAADRASQALIFAKLEKDYDEMFAQFEIDPSQDQELPHDSAKAAFINMGYCVQEDQYDTEAWNDIWKMMSAKQSKATPEEGQEIDKSSSDEENTEPTVSVQKLKVYMCALQNLDMPWMQEVDASMTSQQIKSIFLANLRMAQNRKDFMMAKKLESKLNSHQEKNLHEPVPTFAPKTNKYKAAQPTTGKQHWEAIIEKGQEYKERHEKLRIMQEEDKYQDPHLTFKPKINPPKVRKGESMTQESEQSQVPVWAKLHNQAEKYQRMRLDRQADTIEWTKEPDAYTFHPEILGDKRAGKQMPTFAQMRMGATQGDQDGDFDEDYGTMLDQQVANLSKQPFGESVADPMEQTAKAGADQNIQQEFDDEEEEDDDPASVCIDIALGNQKHRITLVADSDPEAVAAAFAQEHNLDAKLQRKLTEQLANNIKNNF